MKWIIYLITTLLMVSLVTAVDPICQDIMHPEELPCQIVSTWKYDDCNLTQIKIYNSVPTLLDTRNFTDFGIRCSLEWNYSDIDSYFWNVTNGDSGYITVEVNEKKMIAIVIGFIAAIIFFAAIGLLNPGKEIGKTGIRIFGYGMALIQLLSLVFILYANEIGVSLVTVLKINFTVMLILVFGIFMLMLIYLTGRLINPSDSEMNKEEKDDKKW